MKQLSVKKGIQSSSQPFLAFLSRCDFLIAAMMIAFPLFTHVAEAQKTDGQGQGNSQPFVFDGLYLEGTLGDDTLIGSERSDHINAGADGKDGGADVIFSFGFGNLIETNRFGSSAVYLSGGDTLVSARGRELYIQSDASSAFIVLENIASDATASSIDVQLNTGINALTSEVGFGRFQGGTGNDLFYFLPREARDEVLHFTLSQGEDLAYVSPNVTHLKVAANPQQPLRYGIDETHILYCGETTTVEILAGADVESLVLFDLCEGGVIRLLGGDGVIIMTPVPAQTPEQANWLTNYTEGLQGVAAEITRSTLFPFGINPIDYAALALDAGVEGKIFPEHYREVVKILENGQQTGLGSVLSALGNIFELPGNLFNSLTGESWKQPHIDKLAAIAGLKKRLQELFPDNGVPSVAEMEDFISRLIDGNLTPDEEKLFEDLNRLLEGTELDLSKLLSEEQILYLRWAQYLAVSAGILCSLESGNPDNPDSVGLCDQTLDAYELVVDMLIEQNQLSCLENGGGRQCESEKAMRDRVYRALKQLINTLRRLRQWSGIQADAQAGAVNTSGSGLFGQ